MDIVPVRGMPSARTCMGAVRRVLVSMIGNVSVALKLRSYGR
jgi:hypothetical protein